MGLIRKVDSKELRKLSVNLAIPEDVIREVLDFQFGSVVDATRRYETVEISGFGKLVFSRKRAKYVMDAYAKKAEELGELAKRDDISSKKRNAAVAKKEYLEKEVGAIKRKLDGLG